jgi:hypothetical protein
MGTPVCSVRADCAKGTSEVASRCPKSGIRCVYVPGESFCNLGNGQFFHVGQPEYQPQFLGKAIKDALCKCGLLLQCKSVFGIRVRTIGELRELPEGVSAALRIVCGPSAPAPVVIAHDVTQDPEDPRFEGRITAKSCDLAENVDEHLLANVIQSALGHAQLPCTSPHEVDVVVVESTKPFELGRGVRRGERLRAFSQRMIGVERSGTFGLFCRSARMRTTFTARPGSRGCGGAAKCRGSCSQSFGVPSSMGHGGRPFVSGATAPHL